MSKEYWEYRDWEFVGRLLKITYLKGMENFEKFPVIKMEIQKTAKEAIENNRNDEIIKAQLRYWKRMVFMIDFWSFLPLLPLFKYESYEDVEKLKEEYGKILKILKRDPAVGIERYEDYMRLMEEKGIVERKGSKYMLKRKYKRRFLPRIRAIDAKMNSYLQKSLLSLIDNELD